MSAIHKILMISFASFALAGISAACGGDGDDGSGLPPGLYASSVSGTMEIQFVDEGVSAAPIRLQESEFAPLEGDIKIELGEGGGFTLSGPDGLILVVETSRGTGTITGGESSEGQTGPPGGTELSLEDLSWVFPPEPVPEVPQFLRSEDPIPLQSPDPLLLGEGITLMTPSDFEGGAFVTPGGTPFFDVISIELTLDELVMVEEPPEASCQQRGDVNGDGEVGNVDAALVLQVAAGLIDSSALGCQDAADVDGDGAVTDVDAALILQFAAGLIESFPALPEATALATDTPAPMAETTPGPMVFTDPQGDEVVAGGGSDPAVDIRSVSVGPSNGGTMVFVELGDDPSQSMTDFSFAVRITLGGQEGLAEVHAGSNNNAPPAGGSLDVSSTGVSIVFDTPVPSGVTLLVETFHLETENSSFGSDTFTVILP